MNTQKSWTKTSSDTILTHEKRHFDITEIYARKLRKAFKEKRFSQSTLNKESKALFNSINKELNKQQVLYDKETNHSINRQQQLNWESKIEKELNALSEYKSIAVSTNIKLK
jgi:predicted secreted Zn-dependent protease